MSRPEVDTTLAMMLSISAFRTFQLSLSQPSNPLVRRRYY
jgi:hypothetical protein